MRAHSFQTFCCSQAGWPSTTTTEQLPGLGQDYSLSYLCSQGDCHMSVFGYSSYYIVIIQIYVCLPNWTVPSCGQKVCLLSCIHKIEHICCSIGICSVNEYTSVWIINIYYNLAQYIFTFLSTLDCMQTTSLFTNLVRDNWNVLKLHVNIDWLNMSMEVIVFLIVVSVEVQFFPSKEIKHFVGK